ncbi:MAG: dTMP kinase [Rhodospirillaceae bacterium]|nr:dTMP kinase [Rhodospirillaceae bacterium]
MARGRFITLEGGEGAGKSTQIALLVSHLQSLGHETIETREPGGSPGAEKIRDLLINGPTDRWDGVTEALLHFAARREHVQKTILPSLERGAWVLCDRFADSTLAYQGYGHGVDHGFIQTLYRETVGDLEPDLTLILDIPVEQGLKRADTRGSGGTRYERMDQAFHTRLREGFLDIARRNPQRCTVIDATASIDQVAAEIRRLVDEKMTPNGSPADHG